MAVTERQHQNAVPHFGAVADSSDLEIAREALADAGHDILCQRPGGAPHGAGLLGFTPRPHRDPAIGELDFDKVLGNRETEFAEPALRAQYCAFVADLGAVGNRDGMFTNAGHQNTWQSTSPPTLKDRASWSDITPRGVDRIWIPSPLLKGLRSLIRE